MHEEKMSDELDCSDYQPGPIPGRVRPVCRYYITQGPGAGACTRPDHFMCELWLASQEEKASRPTSATPRASTLEQEGLPLQIPPERTWHGQ